MAGSGWSPGSYHDYDREYCVDLAQLAAFLRDTQPDVAEALALDEDGPTRRKFLARLQGEDLEAGHHRGAAPRHQTPGARPRPVLRHAVARQRAGQGTLRAEPLHRHAAASLQPRRDAAGAGYRALHQRTAGLHVRAEEQPDQADGGRRGLAVPQGPQPAREAVRARPLRGALRRGRERGAVLHPPEGQGVVVPPLQSRLERRRRQPAQPERDQDGLPVARGADPREPDEHPGELRPAGGVEGREDRQEAADADLASLSPASR